MHKVFDFLADNWLIITPIVYEVSARLTPTKTNVSLIDFAVKILGVILKNRRKPQPTDLMSGDTEKNIVTVDVTKHIIS
jgi:hypothetical protein